MSTLGDIDILDEPDALSEDPILIELPRHEAYLNEETYEFPEDEDPSPECNCGCCPSGGPYTCIRSD